MSYQVIARKYRPQRFADVVGQEHVTQTLANAIGQKRIAHAYLFCGPRGTGKTTIARIFAKCLNCTGGPKADFAEGDERAQEIADGRSLDVLEIDGASNNGVEQVRELRETCKFAPAVSPFKIYIIDEVHMLSTAAFNALLKTLEEPPAHVKFLFATTDPQKVLPTILSRCQRFDLRRIPSPLIAKHLAWIAQKENVQIDAAALYAIARGADGGLRDAESTLDQLISFCGNKIEEADVLSMFGLTSLRQILAITGAVIEGNAETALRELNELAKNGKDLSRLVSELLNLFRNLLIFQVSKGDQTLLEVSEEEAAALAERAAQISTDALTRIMEVLSDCEGRLRDVASKKTLIEVALFRAIQARNAVPIDTVLKRLQDLRASGGGGRAASAPAAAAPTPAAARPSLSAAFTATASAPEVLREAPGKLPEKPAAAPVAASAPVAATAPMDLETLWASVLEGVGRASPFMRSHLAEAFPASFEKGVFVIGFDPEFSGQLALVDNAKNRTVLQTKLAELGHRDALVKFIEKEAPAGRVPVTPPATGDATQSPGTVATAKAAPKEKAAPVSADDFKNDPLIKQALELFKGTIVEVRT